MEVRKGVAGVRSEVGVVKQVGVGAESEVCLRVTGHHRRLGLVMYHEAHRALFLDHLSTHAAAVYRRIVWTRNLRTDD